MVSLCSDWGVLRLRPRTTEDADANAPPARASAPYDGHTGIAEDREPTLEGTIQEDVEVEHEDEGVNEHARILKQLEDYENQIRDLQLQRNQLTQQARTSATLEAVKQAEIRRNRLLREIELSKLVRESRTMSTYWS